MYIKYKILFPTIMQNPGLTHLSSHHAPMYQILDHCNMFWAFGTHDLATTSKATWRDEIFMKHEIILD
jgi:hypothetical protein